MARKRDFTRGWTHVKKPRTPRGRSYINIAMKALSMAKYVKSIVNVEKKYLDLTDTRSVPQTGFVVLLTGIAQGTSAQNREGLSLKATSNSMKYDLLLQNVDAVVRCIIFIDTSSNGVLPLVAEVLTAAQPFTVSHYNKGTIGERFKILSDKTITLNTQNFSNRHETIYDKLNHHVKYTNNPTGAQAECISGHLYALFVADQPTLANEPLITWSNRFSFVDN